MRAVCSFALAALLKCTHLAPVKFGNSGLRNAKMNQSQSSGLEHIQNLVLIAASQLRRMEDVTMFLAFADNLFGKSKFSFF